MDDTLVDGRISVRIGKVRFESDDAILVWPTAAIRSVSYEPTHPVDIERAAGGNVDAAGDIALGLAMDFIPRPAISILLEDPEGIVEEGLDIRVVFETEYRAKLAVKRIQAALDPRYSAAEPAHESREVDELPDKWTRVQRGMVEMRRRLRNARTEEECQTVGLLCREILISLAQVVYDPTVHAPLTGVESSPTDAARMLEGFLGVELRGPSNEAVRRHARAALSLANALQHRRTATTRDAALCAEATVSTVNIFAIVAGRHAGT